MKISFGFRAAAALLALALLTAFMPVFAEETAPVSFSGEAVEHGGEMLKYGNIYIEYPADEALKLLNYGDIVSVDLGQYGVFEAPVCAGYEDVPVGEILLRVKAGKDCVTLAINGGVFALEAGLIEAAGEGAQTAYVFKDGFSLPMTIVITKKTSGSDTFLIGKLNYTLERGDYPGLTDAEFANFRPVTTAGIGEGKLYRSSSPINPVNGRAAYADAACAEAGIRTFINIADTEAGALGYEGYAGSYYSGLSGIFLGLPVAYTSEAYGEGLALGLRFMLVTDAPYLIHCDQGKDRAGLVCALLECLMGANLDEVCADYAVTYNNYFSVDNGVKRDLTQAETDAVYGTICRNLSLCFGTEITGETDLAAAAESYLLSIGLDEDEIGMLKDCLR